MQATSSSLTSESRSAASSVLTRRIKVANCKFQELSARSAAHRVVRISQVLRGGLSLLEAYTAKSNSPRASLKITAVGSQRAARLAVDGCCVAACSLFRA